MVARTTMTCAAASRGASRDLLSHDHAPSLHARQFHIAVPDAIASGLPQFTSFVAPDGRFFNTDIPNDFRIYRPFAVVKPAGASYLFLSIVDDQYWDNHTRAPDMLGVHIAARTDGTIPEDPNPHNLVPPYTSAAPTTTPEPHAYLLLTWGLISLGVVSWRRRRHAA